MSKTGNTYEVEFIRTWTQIDRCAVTVDADTDEDAISQVQEMIEDGKAQWVEGMKTSEVEFESCELIGEYEEDEEEGQ